MCCALLPSCGGFGYEHPRVRPCHALCEISRNGAGREPRATLGCTDGPRFRLVRTTRTASFVRAPQYRTAHQRARLGTDRGSHRGAAETGHLTAAVRPHLTPGLSVLLHLCAAGAPAAPAQAPAPACVGLSRRPLPRNGTPRPRSRKAWEHPRVHWRLAASFGSRSRVSASSSASASRIALRSRARGFQRPGNTPGCTGGWPPQPSGRSASRHSHRAYSPHRAPGQGGRAPRH